VQLRPAHAVVNDGACGNESNYCGILLLSLSLSLLM
jgi:hypothetical protein